MLQVNSLINFTAFRNNFPRQLSLQILQHTASLVSKLFEMGWGQTGHFFKLRREVGHTAVMHHGKLNNVFIW
jgi:hypothetical protein